jgi:hypothetical protein
MKQGNSEALDFHEEVDAALFYDSGIARRAISIAALLRRVVSDHAGAICVLQK